MKPELMRHMSLMLDFYGALLSERQRELCELYYNDDLSLSEVAENTDITRQGVRDALKKAEAIMNEAEERLGLYSAWQSRKQEIDFIKERLSSLGVADEELEASLARLLG